MWKFAFAFLILASSARAREQATAYEALQVVRDQFHRAALSRIISVTGVDGDPQPTKWNILIADRNAPGGTRELQVAGGQIVSNQTTGGTVVGTSEGATIKTSLLNLDSSGAFSVASYTADKAHTNFDFVSYTLRTNDRGTPVWIVTLQDSARRPLGTIHIAANRGNVTRVEGMYRGANMANVEQDPVKQHGRTDEPIDNGRDEADQGGNDGDIEESDGDENVVKTEIKRMFHRTKRDAERMFHRVSRSFDDFINRR
jgi:hypothetical protein